MTSQQWPWLGGLSSLVLSLAILSSQETLGLLLRGERPNVCYPNSSLDVIM